MRVVILSNDKPSFQKPMADGLARILQNNSVTTKVLYEGLDSLEFPYVSFRSRLISFTKRLLKSLFKSNKLLFINRSIGIEKLIKRIKDFDAVIVIAHFPSTMAKRNLVGLEIIRERTTVPIINYDLVFVNNADGWFKKIKEEDRFGGFTGLERFDYYLVASDNCEIPVNPIAGFPYLKMGLDLRSRFLKTHKQEFNVLLDFPRIGFESYRLLQKEVLDELSIPYRELKGTYSPSDIRKIYSSSSAFFLSFRETFGLPIVELQLCGAKIFLPYSHWAPSHYLKKSDEPGVGKLGSNFIVYGNDRNKLKSELLNLRTSFNSRENLFLFKTEYPDFEKCNMEGVKKFISLLESGQINASSHKNYNVITDNLIYELPQNLPESFRSSC